MDRLYFLGYSIDEPLPWHSTLSRTRQLYPEALFELLFDKVFRLCVANNMTVRRAVAGRRVALDSAPVKANASMERLLEKQPQRPDTLLIKDKQLQAEEARRQRQLLYTSLVVLALIGGLLAMLYRNNRQKQQAKRR